MNKFKYELETKTEGDTITQTMYFYSDMDEDTQRELMYVNVMQTQDASQRQALEKLGWVNPHGRQVKSTLHKFLNWFNKQQTKENPATEAFNGFYSRVQSFGVYLPLSFYFQALVGTFNRFQTGSL